MRRALGATSAVIAGSVCALVLGSAPAVADSTIVVRGTSFPHATRAQLSFVGCSGIFAATPETIQPYVGIGPGAAPAGVRSLKYDLAGGNAMGSLHYVSSMQQTTTAALSVRATAGAQGVAYAGYQEGVDDGTSRVWFGRATLSGAGTGWQRIEATGLSYQWTKYDMATERVIEQGPETAMSVPAFTELRGGDGPGLYTIGFGCDGLPFHMDALQVGTPGNVTTYDLEGYDTSTAIAGHAHRIVAGEDVLLTGSVRHSGSERLADATLILEQRPHGATAWETVQVGEAGVADPTVKVAPVKHTVYRWRFADRPLAEASTSAEFGIDVAPRLTASVEWADGAPSRVTGTTTPARAGVEATLWRVTPSGVVKAGRARTDADGRYRLSVLGRSSGRYLVSVPAGDGNVVGRSPGFTLGGATPTPTPEPEPTPTPSAEPTGASSTPAPSMPTLPPSATPSGQPTPLPTTKPSTKPSSSSTPTAKPSPTDEPTDEPSDEPSGAPTGTKSGEPTRRSSPSNSARPY